LSILICGASGFIGRNIYEHFQKQHDVFGTYFRSKPFNRELIKANLTNKIEVDKIIKDKNIIIQAAATTSGAKDILTKPYYHVTDNAVMNSLIFRSAFENRVSHVIFFSCSSIYQQNGKKLLDETDLNLNKGPFQSYFGVGWTKIYIEKLCEFYSRISDTKYTVIRHSNIYGPYDKFDLERSHVFGATVTKVMTAKDKIIVWGDGEEKRDLLYVSDLVDFVNLILKKQKSKFEIYNIGYGSSISINELVKKVMSHAKKNLKIEFNLSKPTIKTNICIDTFKANQLGWLRKVTFDQGIEKTIKWGNENSIWNNYDYR